jgi:putative phosphoesterase
MPGRSRSVEAGSRVLLVSDTHGQVDPRIAELAMQADIVVHAGDIGDAQVLESLRPPGGRIYAVRGNNDTSQKWASGGRAVLRTLSDQVVIDLPGGTLIATHGDRVQPASQRHERLRRLYPDARAVVYGHTHRAVCDRGASPWVLNPGAAGRVRTFGGPTCLLLSANRRCWTVRLIRFALRESRDY